MKIPNKIYFQVDEEDINESTWSLERINDSDVEYVQRKAKKPISPYMILESEKYDGCYNIYDRKTGDRVKYFAENDKKNKARAIEWVMSMKGNK